MVGRLNSVWDGIFSGAMLNFRWVPVKVKVSFSQGVWVPICQDMSNGIKFLGIYLTIRRCKKTWWLGCWWLHLSRSSTDKQNIKHTISHTHTNKQRTWQTSGEIDQFWSVKSRRLEIWKKKNTSKIYPTPKLNSKQPLKRLPFYPISEAFWLVTFPVQTTIVAGLSLWPIFGGCAFNFTLLDFAEYLCPRDWGP